MQAVRLSRTLLSRCRIWDDVWDMIDYALVALDEHAKFLECNGK